MIEIRNRFTNDVLFTSKTAETMRAAVREAVAAKIHLSGADLSRADLSRADLSRADLSEIKTDLFAVLDLAHKEVPTLLAKLRAGKVDGSVYEGECCCLVGTIANARGCRYDALGELSPQASRPAERWFLAILKGSTPENDPIAAITAGWIEEWLTANPSVKADDDGMPHLAIGVTETLRGPFYDEDSSGPVLGAVNGGG